MRFEDYFDFEEPDLIRLKGHRIGLHHLVKLHRQGYTAEQIALEYPGVSMEQINAALTYYRHNQAEVDAMIARIDAQAEAAYQAWLQDPNGGQSPRIQRLRAVRSKWQHEQASTGS